jgi:hypothetical protein
MRPLTQLGYISEALAGLVSVRGVTVKQSVLREQSYESASENAPSKLGDLRCNGAGKIRV